MNSTANATGQQIERAHHGEADRRGDGKTDEQVHEHSEDDFG